MLIIGWYDNDDRRSAGHVHYTRTAARATRRPYVAYNTKTNSITVQGAGSSRSPDLSSTSNPTGNSPGAMPSYIRHPAARSSSIDPYLAHAHAHTQDKGQRARHEYCQSRGCPLPYHAHIAGRALALTSIRLSAVGERDGDGGPPRDRRPPEGDGTGDCGPLVRGVAPQFIWEGLSCCLLLSV